MNQRILLGSAAAIALVIGLYLAVVIAPPSEPESPQYMQQYPQPRALPPFALYTGNQGEFTQQDLQDNWTLAFVGYTFCPDICPTTLAELNRIYPLLQQQVKDTPLQVLFISVDPNRDDAQRLGEYIRFFNPDFIAASAEHKTLFPLVRAMGMMYAIADDTSDGEYLVDHSAAVVVINPQGQVIGRFKPTHAPGQLAISDGDQILADLPRLLAR
ncbi:SCO family protein [Aestuariibacter halophilus]|uniref:SCO family protein n=1 Tax=Fluctibacter halophilus TaxID=226011 RepID=A0ABS8GCT3_9ALTE|nr:SCO family protein [Aestuariibacter halophilus]MCC2617011.1 SCO family protein [Aestuariibacter halophilus]